jgi:hypothetical protein
VQGWLTSRLPPLLPCMGASTGCDPHQGHCHSVPSFLWATNGTSSGFGSSPYGSQPPSPKNNTFFAKAFCKACLCCLHCLLLESQEGK